jgi:antitoxin (DNA-binding transcriptional repressor) of toxin-antitoxin stability system
MKVYTSSEARRHLSDLLDRARTEEVLIKRRGGDTFSVRLKRTPESPFDVEGIDTDASTEDILEAVRESRSRWEEPETDA